MQSRMLLLLLLSHFSRSQGYILVKDYCSSLRTGVMIIVLFYVREDTRIFGFITSLPETHLTKEPAYPKHRAHVTNPINLIYWKRSTLSPQSLLSEAQSALCVSACSRLIFVELDGEQNALSFGLLCHDTLLLSLSFHYF